MKVLGIDLAKQSFQVHGVNDKGVTVLRRTFSKEKLFELV
ncbi:MAG: IS110 family transposase, partial [Magnetococcus sp. YQC-9]